MRTNEVCFSSRVVGKGEGQIEFTIPTSDSGKALLDGFTVPKGLVAYVHWAAIRHVALMTEKNHYCTVLRLVSLEEAEGGVVGIGAAAGEVQEASQSLALDGVFSERAAAFGKSIAEASQALSKNSRPVEIRFRVHIGF